MGKNFFTISDKAYDKLNAFALYLIPAIATFWIALSTIWEIPNGDKIAGSITAFAVLLGVFVTISKKKYQEIEKPLDGDILLDLREDGVPALTVALENEKTMDSFMTKDEATFRIVRK